MEELMLKVDHVTKEYRLGQIGGTTLRDELQRLSARLHHREDPTRQIGARTYADDETFMALNDVSFEVKKGERVGIIGHNGAGKSTLLKLISRVTAPTGGDIWLNGRVASMLEVGTGFHGELTGRENIYMNGAILGMRKKEIDAKIEDIIEFSECRQFIDTPVKRYSSGMYVKLAFSVAAHLDSEIMIMDEVLAVGDVNFQQKCLEKMRNVAASEGRTILYVSHNMSTIRALCSRCICLTQGKLVYDGDVENGIQIYTDVNAGEHKRVYDVREMARKADLPSDCRIQEITVENSELVQNDDLVFFLSISSDRDIDKVMLRFVLYNKQNIAIGTAYSEMVSVKEGNNRIKNVLSTRQLAQGEYYADIILMDYNNGKQVRHDLITSVIYFSVQEIEHKYNMAWRTNAWGNVMLEDITSTNEGE